MADQIQTVMERIFARTDALLEAAERGEDITPHVQRMQTAAPFDLIAIGQAAVADELAAEIAADDQAVGAN